MNGVQNLAKKRLVSKPYILFMQEALGNDEEEIKNFIGGCNKEDLYYMSEFFKYIYGKFTNDEMWDLLTEIESKAGIN